MSHPFVMPTIPAELAEIIATHKGLFGGFRMADDPDPKDPAKTDSPKVDPPDDPKADPKEDEALGEAGKAALVKEREARKALEKQLAELTPMKGTLDALRSALGGGSEVKPEDALKALTDKVGALEHQTLVERVARDHKITAEEDVKLLSAMQSEDEIRALAKRLATTEEPDDKDKGKKPRPDASAGKGGGDSAGKTGVSAGRDLFKETHPSKTT